MLRRQNIVAYGRQGIKRDVNKLPGLFIQDSRTRTILDIEREIRNKQQQNLWPSIDEFIINILHTSNRQGMCVLGYIKPGRFVSILSIPAFEFQRSLDTLHKT